MRSTTRMFVVGCFAGAIVLWVAIALVFPRSLDKQYLAPRFTCACGHTVVIEFSDGRVRLYNLGHHIYFEAGKYETNGNARIWHLPMYHTDFVLAPGHLSLVATDPSTGNHVTLKRRLSPFGIREPFDTSAFRLSKHPLEEYLKDLRWVIDERQAPNKSVELTGARHSAYGVPGSLVFFFFVESHSLAPVAHFYR